MVEGTGADTPADMDLFLISGLLMTRNENVVKTDFKAHCCHILNDVTTSYSNDFHPSDDSIAAVTVDLWKLNRFLIYSGEIQTSELIFAVRGQRCDEEHVSKLIWIDFLWRFMPSLAPISVIAAYL